MKIVIIGGGAAGFFAAITCAEANPAAEVIIFERGKSVLEKVRISGGGRCNVTHACFDPRELIKYYPRGSRELLGPFMQFGPADTVEWFAQRGVALKEEADGRMFPVTDNSESIVQCLLYAAQKAKVSIRTSTRVEQILQVGQGWQLQLAGQSTGLSCAKVMIATGSSTSIWEILSKAGHTIISPVPSLFTFNTKDARLRDLSGLSVANARVQVAGTKLMAEGPLLITHWGLSGPAILRLSAWGARDLHTLDHKFELLVNWISSTEKEVLEVFNVMKVAHGKKTVFANAQFGMPQRLWQHLVMAVNIIETERWADVNKGTIQNLTGQIVAGRFQITGKSTFKEEFVTAGGVDLKEINFKNFSSRILPHLFLAGEVLNVDAITGGFNFQAAWTGGRLAGLAMAKEPST